MTDRPEAAIARVATIAILVTIVTIGSGAAGVGTGAAVNSHAVAVADGQPAVAQNATPVRHVDPEAVGADGDVRAVEAWLRDRLSERLTGSAGQLDQVDFDQARSMLGDDYRRLLDRDEILADQTESEADDRAVQSFRRAGDAQRELVQEIESYRENYQEYQQAQRAGNRHKRGASAISSSRPNGL